MWQTAYLRCIAENWRDRELSLRRKNCNLLLKVWQYLVPQSRLPPFKAAAVWNAWPMLMHSIPKYIMEIEYMIELKSMFLLSVQEPKHTYAHGFSLLFCLQFS